TEVSVTAISPSAATMTANVTVRAGKGIVKEIAKEIRKEIAKEGAKDTKDLGDTKVAVKDAKDIKEIRKEIAKDIRKDVKENVKELKDQRKDIREKILDNRWDWGRFGTTDDAGYAAGDPVAMAVGLLEQAIALLTGGGEGGEPGAGAAYGAAEPFIDATLRPDLVGSPTYEDASKGMAEGDAAAKRHYDAAPQG
ncbi:MAG: protease, partial [Tetrasphaera sp.]|nr:protease [Tetrasphaera sp.]